MYLPQSNKFAFRRKEATEATQKQEEETLKKKEATKQRNEEMAKRSEEEATKKEKKKSKLKTNSKRSQQGDFEHFGVLSGYKKKHVEHAGHSEIALKIYNDDFYECKH